VADIIVNEKLAFLATNLAYKLKEPNEYTQHQKATSKDLSNTGWEVLCNSVESSEYIERDQTGYSYRAVALVNNHTKEIHIAAAGTDESNKHDILDDAVLSLGRVPYKIETAQNMISHVIAGLGGEDKAKDYKFSTSGHSLGAIISDLTAVDLISRGFEVTESVTFENPGSYAAVERAKKQNLFTKEISDSMEELAKCCKVYNAPPNFINKAGKQLGKVSLVLPKSSLEAKEVVLPNASELESEKYPTEKDPVIQTWCSYLYNKVGAAVSLCTKLVGAPSIADIKEAHGLHRFEDIKEDAHVFSAQTWPQNCSITNNSLIIEHPAQLDQISATGKCVLTAQGSYSFEDLRRACEPDSYGKWEMIEETDGNEDWIDI